MTTFAANVRRIAAGLVLLVLLAFGMWAWHLTHGGFEISVADLAAKYQLPDSHFADIDGVRVHYVDQGQGPAIVLVHASNMNLRTWDQLAAALRATHRVVRFDMMMSGLSGAPSSGDFSINRNLAILDELTKKLALDKFSVLGTSSGGIVAFRYAALHPEHVDRLILVNCAGLPRTAATDPNRARGTALERWINHYYRSYDYWQKTLTTQFGGGTAPPADFVKMVYDTNRRAGLVDFGARYISAFSTGDPEGMLAKVRARTLILWGIGNITVDHLQADVFEHWLTGAPTLKIKYPKVGHYLYLEIPDRFNRDVAKFLNGEFDSQLRITTRSPMPQIR